MLKSGAFHRNLQFLRKEYHKRCQVICSQLHSLVATLAAKGQPLTFLDPKGGYFIWVQLPPSVSARQLLDLERESVDVRFLEGSRCSCKQDSFSTCVRLCYAHYSVPQLTAAMEEFSRLVVTAVNEHVAST